MSLPARSDWPFHRTAAPWPLGELTCLSDIWDIDAGKEIGQLKGHSGRIETVAFAPDGKTLASGATDTTILLWDAARPLKELAQVQAVELPATELETLWGDLAQEDAAKALRAVLQAMSPPRGKPCPS